MGVSTRKVGTRDYRAAVRIPRSPPARSQEPPSCWTPNSKAVPRNRPVWAAISCAWMPCLREGPSPGQHSGCGRLCDRESLLGQAGGDWGQLPQRGSTALKSFCSSPWSGGCAAIVSDDHQDYELPETVFPSVPWQRLSQNAQRSLPADPSHGSSRSRNHRETEHSEDILKGARLMILDEDFLEHDLLQSRAMLGDPYP